jgi:hypothetical protein
MKYGRLWNALEILKHQALMVCPLFFYKNIWHIVGDRIKQEVLVVLNGGPMPEGWNKTIIVLIPKTSPPCMLKDLRPISLFSLCNVLYKLISKVLTNRLKRFLAAIISLSQSAFVLGRLITDNVLLSFELSHYLKSKKKVLEGLAALKLDMSKAYDRIEWDFLRKMMIWLCFQERWVQLLMKCVTSVSYKIKINGSHASCFINSAYVV